MGNVSYVIVLNHTNFSNEGSTRAFISIVHFCLLSWFSIMPPRGKKTDKVNIFAPNFYSTKYIFYYSSKAGGEHTVQE